VNSGSAVNLVISTGAAQVSVPNVVGDTQAAATTAITGAGLVVGTITTVSSSSVPSGDVISESPSAGTSVNSGSAVTLLISTGAAQVVVPNVVGDTQAAATTAITAVGLVVGTVTQQSSPTVASGNVISESPSAGTTVNSSSAVNLVVSSGPAPVAVPNVVGDTQAAATSAIVAAGLALGTVSTASSATVASGEVISENPSAGSSVSPGSAINLVVSTGPAVAPSYTLSANPSSLTIKSGSSASTVITLTPTGGFTGTVNFTCGTLPTHVTCTFVPTSLTVTSSTAQTTTLTIGTTGPAMASLGDRPAGTVLPTLLAALILLPLGFMRRVLRARKGASQWFGLLLLAGTCLAAAGLLGTVGCGGSSSSTPTGAYNIPITVTSGSLTVPLNLSITVD
jgi:beta-lactam-binding protein with PASTA domain